MSDRTVHATLADGSELARYDRAGKWFREWPDRGLFPSKSLRLAEVVALALEPGSRVYLDKPGGGSFDARVRRVRMTAAPTGPEPRTDAAVGR